MERDLAAGELSLRRSRVFGRTPPWKSPTTPAGLADHEVWLAEIDPRIGEAVVELILEDSGRTLSQIVAVRGDGCQGWFPQRGDGDVVVAGHPDFSVQIVDPQRDRQGCPSDGTWRRAGAQIRARFKPCFTSRPDSNRTVEHLEK